MHSGFQMPLPPPPLMNPPPQIFGGYNEHGLSMAQLPPDLLAAQMFGDHGLLEDTNEAKRRRIARVSRSGDGVAIRRHGADLTLPAGMRYVPEEEDQVRWQVAGLHALHQLQDRMRLYAGGKEAESSQGVSVSLFPLNIFKNMLADRLKKSQVYRGAREPLGAHGAPTEVIRYA